MAGKYMGAGFKGTVDWDNEPYFVKSDAQLLKVMQDTIKASHLAKHVPTFNEMALKAVCINPSVPDNYSKVGNTRFGGLPDLPLGVDYPSKTGPYRKKGFEHYSFFAQINCAELAPYQAYLPREGILYFFVTDEDEYHSEVWYYPKPDRLVTGMALQNIDFNNPYRHEPYKPYRAEFRKLIALPAYFDDMPLYKHEDEAYGSFKERHALTNMPKIQSFSESLGRKGIFRQHNKVYYTDMNHTINDSVLTIGGDSPYKMAADSRGGDPEDWMVLLRLFSHYESEFQFYDAGELYFMIHKSDLAKRHFSNVFSFAESS